MPQASQVLPSSGPAVQSLPKSPDRPGSTSPFAPSATDLPGMPEPALTSRANTTGKDPGGLVGVKGSRTEALGEGIVSIRSMSQAVHKDRQAVFIGKTRQGGLQGVEGKGEPMFHLNWTTGLPLLAIGHGTRPSAVRPSE